MKQCRKCNQIKFLDQFSKKSSEKDGLRNICKCCQKLENNKNRQNYNQKIYNSKRTKESINSFNHKRRQDPEYRKNVS